jgi:hypothetical protein
MTEQNNLIETELKLEAPTKIYSKKAVWAFSVIFAPIFGGVLLRQNLIEENRKHEANIVLLASILFTAFTIVIVNSIEKTSGSFTYLINMGWGLILSEYFFKKYYPNEVYEYKSVWKAVFISIAILIPFLLAIIYAPVE